MLHMLRRALGETDFLKLKKSTAEMVQDRVRAACEKIPLVVDNTTSEWALIMTVDDYLSAKAADALEEAFLKLGIETKPREPGFLYVRTQQLKEVAMSERKKPNAGLSLSQTPEA